VSDRLLSARELAEYLGFQAGTIVDWAEAGTVPAFKLGGKLRFRLSEVEAWLEGRRLTGGGVSATPTAGTDRGLVSPLSATPNRGGPDAC